MEKKKILFISQEIAPFSPKNEISATARRLPQAIQDAGKEIRVFAPKFGSINERRHQLHEVIRLSGMNIVIDDTDHPLIIKVASIAQARMQVYFIDNEEFFRRKNNTTDENNEEYVDNDERSIFFCRGVLETVKKLGWQPDVIHCHGWMTVPLGLYLKKVYNKDPHFADTKVVYSLYDNKFNKNWDERLAEKLKFDGIDKETIANFKDTDFYSVTASMLKYFDGVNIASESLCPKLEEIYTNLDCCKQDFVAEEHQNKVMSEFFDRIIEEALV
ncbi:MAG TPA: glycogen/starch synthase [Taishania sp.]|nr:glycogen/starch synthase [Taishania sp.]HNS41375.1 glycogen/starch synthase [Taishania sp.]